MIFTKRGGRVYTTVTTIDLSAWTSPAQVAFRIDGREGDYRVDLKTSSFGPWEAIDGGLGFSSVKKAKSYVARWHRAATAQRTLSPAFRRGVAS